ncbi:MAG: heavy-metal-associated domain-containing protein [Dehalococcoidia bacterium]
MPQMTLFAPDVTCDHCIATIKKTVDAVDGASFVDGDPDSKSFAIEVAQGAVLDRVAEALAGEGYPLGDATPAKAAAGGAPVSVDFTAPVAPAFAPTYTVEKSAEGASITYTCPCGSTTEHYTFDRSKAEQDVGACCDHHLLVQPGAAERLRSILGEGYALDVQTVEMPWGQPVEAAFASKG